MRGRLICLLVLAAGASPALAQQWNFDAYASGTQQHGVDGWKGWDNLLTAGAATSNAFAHSGTGSIAIQGSTSGATSDLVQPFAASSGSWVFTTWQYIPSAATGADTYFILMDTYNDNGAKHWATQVRFDLTTNTVYDNLTGTNPTLTIARDQWVPIQVAIDLTANTQVVTYNNQLLLSAPWLRYGGGQMSVAAVDLYGSSANTVYYDDVGFASVPAPSAAVLAGLVAMRSTTRRRRA